MENPLFTFVMPVYAARPAYYKAVTRALRSLESQSSRDFEVVMVNDGNNPTMAALVSEARAVMGLNIRYYQVPFVGVPGGHVAVQFGISQARGEFVTILNGDNTVRPGYIADMYSPDYDILIGMVKLHSRPGYILTGENISEGRVDRLNYSVRTEIAKWAKHEGTKLNMDWYFLCRCLEWNGGDIRIRNIETIIGEHR